MINANTYYMHVEPTRCAPISHYQISLFNSMLRLCAGSWIVNCSNSTRVSNVSVTHLMFYMYVLITVYRRVNVQTMKFYPTVFYTIITHCYKKTITAEMAQSRENKSIIF